MSVIHPGSSLNFDGADLQRSEEEEIQREDIKQQQELHELLSAELPEDLLEDSCEGSPAVSHDQGKVPHAEAADAPWHPQLMHGSAQPDQRLDAQYYGHQMQPIPYSSANDYSPFMNKQSFDESLTDAEKWQMRQQQRYPYNNNFQSRGALSGFQRDQGVGDYGYRGNDFNAMTAQNDVYGFAERREAEGSEDFDAISGDPSFNHRDNKLSSTLPSQGGRGSITPGKNVRFDAFSAPTSPYSYGGGPKYLSSQMPHSHSSDSVNIINRFERGDDSLGSDYVDASDRQSPDVSDVTRELNQLRVLYEARGKKIDKLSREVDSLQGESDRQKRILNHQLNMAKDEKNGMSGSLDECQRLLVEKDRCLNEGEAKINSLKVEVESLKSAKSELVRKLEVGERSIENLQQEVAMLQRSDTLDRARQQHDAVLASTNERHEQQLLEVTSMLDVVRREADGKNAECEQLRTRLKSALKESEDLLFEKSETINKLSRSLEEAQNQCQTLLAGSGESAFLHRQISNITLEKNDLAERTQNMQIELNETKELVRLYENAFQLGATKQSAIPDGLTDSYSELMGGNKWRSEWKLPEIQSKKSPDDLVGSLRSELERALKNNKDKRDKIAIFQCQLKDLNEESRHWRERADQAENKLAKTGMLIPAAGSATRRRSFDQEQEYTEAIERAESAENRVMRLEETCRDVKQQMCEMIEQHDANKQEAVDRCERACMQLHEDAKQALRDELLADYEQRLYEASVEHDGEMERLKSELESLSNELSEVKQSYVHVCAEKDKLDENLRQELRETFENDKNAIMKKYEDEKGALLEEWDRTERDKEQDLEKDIEELTKNKVALAKIAWMNERAEAEQQNLRQALDEKEKDVQTRLDKLEEDLMLKLNREKEEELQKAKDIWNQLKEKEIKDRIDEFYEEMKEQEQAAITTATSIAQLNWITEQQNLSEEDQRKRVQSALDEARRTWMDEQEVYVNNAVDEALHDARKEIKSLKEKRDDLVTMEVEKLEREWKRKKDDALRKKEDQMEEELKKLEEKHQQEYEEFKKKHQKSLDQFLQNERSKEMTSQTWENQKELISDLRHQWTKEREHLISSHQNELERLRKMSENRCLDYKAEIERLSSAYDHITRQQSCGDVSNMEKKYKEEMERLKSRMRDEYRRWKRDRSALQAKLDNATSSGQKVPSGELEELRKIYCATLNCIKDEMLSFVRDGRASTLNALKHESHRERKRIFEKLRQSRSSDAVLPSFLVDGTSVDRIPVKLAQALPADQPGSIFSSTRERSNDRQKYLSKS